MKNATQDSALLNAIMDAAVDAMVISDAHGVILRANPAAGQMFGYEISEMLGQSVNMLMPQALGEGHDRFMSDYMLTGEKHIIDTGRDIKGQRKDGSVFPLHISVGETKATGAPMFVSIMHDLTYRHATQAALSRSQRLDAIGQMTAGIAHDFNNLLTVVIGNLELLDMRGPTDRQTPLIRDAMDAAELGADLTSRLMVFARKSNLKPVESDLRDLCKVALNLLKRTLGAAYRIRTDFAADLKPVMVDPVELKAALINLALNARDAMGQKGELLISLANVTIDDTYMAQETDIESGEYVRLSVSDNGKGMTPEAQNRAFEPFFTTRTDSGGTGLGLSMVYGFVRQSGGHITLYSELGHGTSFGLYFPVSGTCAAPDSDEACQQREDALPHGHGQVVLVVEDNPKVRQLAVDRIRKLGYHTEEAETGDAAFERLQAGLQVDILFSDLVMPGKLSGYELAAKVQTEFPSIKVLLTSGYASDVVTGKMQYSQSQDILHKPYHHADLAQRLQALLVAPSED
ncbi:PAS domain S-box-containing protein [Roseovarius marisflavi]|uniref:Sensor protein FixL n=1 Tax=Roseovarius marisflavi TaxID=1054996 RepID=A0A1M7AER1_9RHOB|nr:PAS domain S-box protein [Roseovarius marisflavi]SHL41019.1 PAS domain S-box-containing protein [Roseovarius marisflavi]